jgi:hypothetical protein
MRQLITAVTLSLCVLSLHVSAQQTPPSTMQHVPGMVHNDSMHAATAGAQPMEGGQAAFAAIAEIVKLLEANPATDWSKVNIEALRQHLIDMDAVTMRSKVAQTPAAGGLMMNVTGDVAVAASIRRMVTAHAPMLEEMGGWRAAAVEIPGGMRLTVTAANPKDSATVARIRGLGFIGLMTEGAHHQQHHLMIATGAGVHAHGGQ